MSKLSLTTLPGAITAHWKRIVLLLVLLLVIGGSVIYFAFFHIYRSDYARALTQVNQTITKYNNLLEARDTAVGQVGDTNELFDESMDNYHEAFNSYIDAITAVSEERALHDSAVNQSYQMLSQKSALFEEFIEEQLALAPVVHEVATSCSASAPSQLNTSDLGKIVEVYDAAMNPCVVAMKQLSETDDEAAAKRGKDAIAYFDVTRKHAVAMQEAYKAGNRSGFESEYNTFLDQLADYKTTIQVADLLDINKEVIPTTQLNDLARVISSRQK